MSPKREDPQAHTLPPSSQATQATPGPSNTSHQAIGARASQPQSPNPLNETALGQRQSRGNRTRKTENVGIGPETKGETEEPESEKGN